MAITVWEIVKEIVFYPSPLDRAVHGRIAYNIGEHLPYQWAVSHHYQPTKDAGLYIPSRDSAESEAEAMALMGMYIEGFASAHAVEANQYW